MKAVKQFFTVVLFVFQFYPVYKFWKFINFGLDTARSEYLFLNLLKTIHERFSYKTGLR